MDRTCAYCGGVFAESEGVGRPNSYCSQACRRSAQSERQRIVRRLERLEDEEMELRHRVARRKDDRVFGGGMQLLPADRLQDVESDIRVLRDRLRALFDVSAE